MEISSRENTIDQVLVESPKMEEIVEPAEKINLDKFHISKFSRWMDNKGRLLIVTGFWYGKDAAKAYSDSFQRIGVDLLLVENKQVEYMHINRFLYFVIHGKIKAWTSPQAPF